MKKVLLGLTVSLTLTVAQGQITFQKTYGGSAFDEGFSTIQTNDGGYVLAGVTESYGSAIAEAYVIKTDSIGNITWAKTYGGSGISHAYSIKQTMDGGFIIAGKTDFGPDGNNIYLIKTDFNGNMQWTKTFGGTSEDVGYSVLQTTDGGYVVAGYTYSYGNNYEVYLIKTNSNGNLLWSKVFGGTDYDMANEVKQTQDGGYIVVGYTMSFGAGTEDVYVIKTDGNGNIQWSKTYGEYSHDFGKAIEQTSDGGYILLGYSPNFGWGADEIYIIKTDMNGDTLWTKAYGDKGSLEGVDIEKTLDGNYVASFSDREFNGRDIYLMKINTMGDTLWTKMYGDTAYQNMQSSIYATTDGGYLLCGKTNNFGAGMYGDMYLVKTDSDGNSGCYVESASSKFDVFTGVMSTNTKVGNPNTTSVSVGTTVFTPPTISSSGVVASTICLSNGISENDLIKKQIYIYPNPFSVQTTLQTDNSFHNATLTVDNCFGQTVAQIKNLRGQTIVFNRDNLVSGLYFVRLTEENKTIAVDKLVIADR